MPRIDRWFGFGFRRVKGWIAVGVAALAISGCGGEETVDAPLPPRVIKYMSLGEVADQASRTLAGVVKAGTRSNVAFELSGRVTELKLNVGAGVKRGDVLALLDAKPFDLKVSEARFTLSQAEASLKDAKKKHFQQEQLWKKRVTTQTAYDTAVSNLRNAEGQVGIAKSQLELRERDLSKTTLRAPFDGRIAEKKIEVFEEISPGQAVYVMQTDNENEVEVVIPENLIGRISIGDDVEIMFPPLNGKRVSANVSEISPVASEANAFPVTLRLASSPDDVRPGMSAEATFYFDAAEKGKAFSIPVGALKPDLKAKSATVFVYDKKEEVVRSRPVQVVGIEDNRPQIVGDLKAGEIIATAGVGHMYDGMKVRLMPKSLRK